MSEKLQTQQMINDLEKLTNELEKIGLNKERLLHDENSDDRYWLKLLHKPQLLFCNCCLNCFSVEPKVRNCLCIRIIKSDQYKWDSGLSLILAQILMQNPPVGDF